MKKLFTLLLILNTIFSFGQKVVVMGHITDYKKDAVQSAKLIYGHKISDFTASTIDGRFEFTSYLIQLDKITIQHSSYEIKTIYLTNKIKKNIKNDTLILNIKLNDYELGEVEVGIKKPKIVFSSPLFSIADYESLPNRKMILLSYEKTLKKGSRIKLIDSNLVELDSYSMTDECVELTKDFRNNIHIITKKGIYLLQINNDRLYIYKEDKDYFYKYLAPIIDTLQDHIYYSNYSEIYPAFDYMEFNKTDSVYKKMLVVEDKPLMEQYRAEFKFSDVRTKLWAHQKQIETGVDKEIWVGAAVFTNSLYYTPLYAPLFIKKDTVLVFDHYENKLYKYLPNIGLIDSVKIKYHFKSRKSGWEHPLIQDKQNDEVYAIFMRNGYTFLSLLNTTTGKIIKTKKLFYKYIEKIQIIDNTVFYIYRPFESTQKKYIYKEPIK